MGNAMKPEILRNIFLLVFVASSLVLILMISAPFVDNVFSQINSSLVPIGTVAPISPTAEPGGSTAYPPPANPSASNDSGALIGSIITSITSLIGFATTTVITWRKEKREAALADMERKKLETELEKSRLELEALKKGGKRKEVKKRNK